MKRHLTKSLWILFLILHGTFMYAQSNSITGTVIDETGETIPGVTVFEKGTTNGTSTEIDGTYSLDLKVPGAVMLFSFTGYETIEVVANKATVDVQMGLDVEVLDQIVVTGIRGAQLREEAVTRKATSVISAITAEDIGSFSDGTVADALQRVPEVQIERDVDGVSGDRVS